MLLFGRDGRGVVPHLLRDLPHVQLLDVLAHFEALFEVVHFGLGLDWVSIESKLLQLVAVAQARNRFKSVDSVVRQKDPLQFATVLQRSDRID